jgi:hypothetical protein
MSEPEATVDQRVLAIFRDVFSERAERLVGSHAATAARLGVEASLRTEFSPEVAKDLAFHLTDWNSDAAFVVALHLFPERFTAEEICAGIRDFLIHAPNQIAAAAALACFPISDIFGVGVRPNEMPEGH